MQEFGRYLLMKEVGAGGMASVYEALSFGEKGFTKKLALKKILPHQKLNKRFTDMLYDEARLAVELHSPNIVQTLDFGKVGEEYYIAMEYIDGISLNDLQKEFYKSNKDIPDEIILFAISEIAKALHYAHTYKDEKGKPLEIVHRDVSPHNILIPYDGEVKLADFGIAKASINFAHTQSGLLKGKVAYMSPEQARGEALDGRSDIFSLGLVLFEIITGHLIFKGDEMISILNELQKEKIDIKSRLNEVPEKYRHVLKGSLALTKEDRYQSALEMHLDLVELLREIDPDYSSFMLGEYLKESFKNKIETERREDEIDIPRDVKDRLKNYTDEHAVSQCVTYSGGDFQAIPSTTSRLLSVLARLSIPIIAFVVVIAFVSDILRPITYVLPAFAGLSLAGILITVITNRKRLPRERKLFNLLERKAGNYFIFFFVLFIASILLLVIYSKSPGRGLLADNFSVVETFQEKILSLESGIGDLKTGIRDIQTNVEDIREMVKELGGQQTIIKNAKKPAELYHNAKLYALWGETQHAIDSYSEFIKKAPYYVDVNESYLTLLKNTEGIASANRIYKKLHGDHRDDPTVQMIYLETQRLPTIEHEDGLKKLVKKYPKYAPGYYEIVKLIHNEGWRNLTHSQKEMLVGSLEKFRKLDREGYFKKYFIDKEALEEKYELMKRIENEYSSFAKALIDKPIDLNYDQDVGGANLYFEIVESNYREVQYGVGSPKKLISLGYLSDGNPNYVITRNMKPGKHVIYFRYMNKNGVWSQTYSKEIKVLPFVVHIIQVPYRSDAINLEFYQYKGSKKISDFKYSIDNKSLNVVAKPSVYEGLRVMGKDDVSVGDLKKGSHILYVKGIYKDNSETKILEFPFEIQ